MKFDVVDRFGISGTTFEERPGVQRLLEDAQNGRINLIICKDLSRFGRNYIEVGLYIDYIFPLHNIRFIALTDNVDTENADSVSMDMLPIMNASVATGRHTKGNVMHPLSGLSYCGDCGSKMRHNGGCERNRTTPVYMCSKYAKYGNEYCSTHTIRQSLLESLVLADIQRQIDIVMNEPDIREKLLAYKRGDKRERDTAAKKRLHDIDKRIKELDRLIKSVYEDKVAGLIPDKVCAGLLGDYQTEKDGLTAEREELVKRTDDENQDERDVDEYIRRMKSYAGAEVLTREMALSLIEYVKVDAHQASTKHREPLRSFISS